MNRAPLTPHCRASVLIISRRLAEELVARAFDGADVLPLADRVALMKLVLAVDVEASRRVGLTTMTREERDALTEALGEMERGLAEGEKGFWREPPEALYARPGDAQLLWGRIPVESWQTPGRYWFCDEDLVDRLKADPFRCFDGSPTAGAARRDEIVSAWDAWRAAQATAEAASGLTAAEERFAAAYAAYGEFRTRLVELQTHDPEILTVKALCIADLCRGSADRLGYGIKRALERNVGAYEDALALSLARDFLGLMGTGVMS